MTNLSAREQRLVAIGLLVAALALAWWIVVKPIADGFADRAIERQRLTTAYARNDRLILAMPRWRARAREQRASAAIFAVMAPTLEAATELSRERVNRIVAGEGGIVKAIREQPGSPGRLRLRADLQLTPAQLVACVRLLENRQPLMVIESLAIAADEAAAVGREAPMEIRMDVSQAYDLVATR